MLEGEGEGTGISPGGAGAGAGARGLPDRLRNWSGRMGGSLSAMVDNLTKGVSSMLLWLRSAVHSSTKFACVIECHCCKIGSLPPCCMILMGDTRKPLSPLNLENPTYLITI